MTMVESFTSMADYQSGGASSSIDNHNRGDNFRRLLFPRVAERPWLTLYSIRIRPPAPPGDLYDNCPLMDLLSEELLHEIFQYLPARQLARAACVCRRWRSISWSSTLWERLVQQAWPFYTDEELLSECVKYYRSSWRLYYLGKPRLRTDGIYVSRNTYVKTGITYWDTRNPVSLVVYYRYYRFFDNGQFVYKTSPANMSKVFKQLKQKPNPKEGVYGGLTQLHENVFTAEIVYKSSRNNIEPTRHKTELRLRSTVYGAHDRLDILSLVTETGSSDNGHEDAQNDGQRQEATAIQHNRGLSSFMFVSFESIHDLEHVMNKTVDQMDFLIIG